MAGRYEFCDRREFLASLAATAAGLTVAPAELLSQDSGKKQTNDDPAGGIRRTYTYKTVGNLEVKADVYLPHEEGAAGSHRRPVLLWIHGGALIMGDRGGIDRRFKPALLKSGCVIVSIDYRLAPETKLPAIIDDVRDAYAWLHDQGPQLFGVDTRRIAVAGGSAGGYLTLMTGFCVKPRPAALVSFWGYGDIAGDWYIKPSQFYRQQPLVKKEDAWKGVDGSPVTDRKRGDRSPGRFYLYCRQQGLWTTNVAGINPRTQDQLLTPYCPVRNVTKDYPPTLLIHGTRDTDVPFEQSVEMEDALTRVGADHRMILVPNAGHGLPGGEPQQVAAAYDAAVDFVNRHLLKD
jgi:acetyl esterase/lipase